MDAITSFFIAFTIGALVYISMSYSNCRESSAYFKKWYSYMRWAILAGYLALLLGVYRFLKLNHLAVEIIYPRYAWDSNKDLQLNMI